MSATIKAPQNMRTPGGSMKMPDRESMKRLILKEPEGDFTAGNPNWIVRDGCIWYESDRLKDQPEADSKRPVAIELDWSKSPW